MNKKEFIQCGYEDRCKNKDCLKCPRINKYNLNLSLAEAIVIEDFAVCELKSIKSRQLNLMQKSMYKLMHKLFSKEKKKKNER